MLEKIVELTNLYIESMPKKERKKYGQFFTSMETARFMTSLYEPPAVKSVVTVLDAGAGSGILSCAFIEWIEQFDYVKEVELVCYENDENVLELLKENLEYCKKKFAKKMTYNIRTENYITSQYLEFNSMIGQSQNPLKVDYVIGNPPYMKISKNAPEAEAMPEVCYGAPNMYFIFAAMGLFNLKDHGEMVYIIPRSWTSGAYFKRFRYYFLTKGKLEHIHLFISRNKVFDKENVLQETMIIKVRKTNQSPVEVKVTSSKSNKDFDEITSLTVPYSLVVSSKDYYVYLVTNNKEVEVLKRLHKFHHTLPNIGVKMKTGLTVDFRNRDVLRDKEEEGTIPLFYSQHIKKGRVQFPIQKENEYVLTDRRGLMQALHRFRTAALIEDNGKATNSPNYRYRLTKETLELLKTFQSVEWYKSLNRFLIYHDKLIDIYTSKKKMTMMPVKINGTDFKFSVGKHNQLQKAIIEEFAPRFAPNAECLYVGDTIEKDLVKNVEKLTALGFEITLHDKMPDVILYREDKNWIYFIESVTSVGPMDPKRIIEITEMTENVTAGKIFVTAFLDFKTYKKFSEALAWETEVWIADMPEHMIHLNGDMFLGPR